MSTRTAARPAGPAPPSRTTALEPVLEPVGAALLAGARAEADRIVADAEAERDRRLEAARAEAGELLAAARDGGRADAVAVVAAEVSAAHRAARGLVLAAQREAYDRLRADACDAVRRRLSADPVLRGRLAALVRERLGPEAVLTEHPEGGLLGETGDGRSVDASVPALVDLALTGFDGERLWTAR